MLTRAGFSGRFADQPARRVAIVHAAGSSQSQELRPQDDARSADVRFRLDRRLVQFGALTPFQTRWLEDFPPERLIAGEFMLLDGLGAGFGLAHVSRRDERPPAESRVEAIDAAR